MREYFINGKQVFLMYRYINEGIDITTKYNDKMFYKHFDNIDLRKYDLLIDLIDDLSYEFIEYVKENELMNNTFVIYDSNDGSRELEVGVITYGDNGELIIRVHEKENING